MLAEYGLYGVTTNLPPKTLVKLKDEYIAQFYGDISKTNENPVNKQEQPEQRAIEFVISKPAASMSASSAGKPLQLEKTTPSSQTQGLVKQEDTQKGSKQNTTSQRGVVDNLRKFEQCMLPCPQCKLVICSLNAIIEHCTLHDSRHCFNCRRRFDGLSYLYYHIACFHLELDYSEFSAWVTNTGKTVMVKPMYVPSKATAGRKPTATGHTLSQYSHDPRHQSVDYRPPSSTQSSACSDRSLISERLKQLASLSAAQLQNETGASKEYSHYVSSQRSSGSPHSYKSPLPVDHRLKPIYVAAPSISKDTTPSYSTSRHSDCSESDGRHTGGAHERRRDDLGLPDRYSDRRPSYRTFSDNRPGRHSETRSLSRESERATSYNADHSDKSYKVEQRSRSRDSSQEQQYRRSYSRK